MTFLSETDTEVIAHLIEQAYTGDFTAAVRAAIARLEGSYALGVLCAEHPDEIVAVRRSSPLIVGLSEEGKDVYKRQGEGFLHAVLRQRDVPQQAVGKGENIPFHQPVELLERTHVPGTGQQQPLDFGVGFHIRPPLCRIVTARAKKDDGIAKKFLAGKTQRAAAPRQPFQSVEKGESAIRETKKAEAGYRSVFARTCASQTLLIGEK